MADGSVSIVEETYGSVKKIAFSWTSGTGAEEGTASGTTSSAYNGEIVRLVTNPDNVDAPDNQYDVVINDEDENDVLMGAGADRSNVNTEQVLSSSLGCVANDKLSISITQAGAANKGSVYLYIR